MEPNAIDVGGVSTPAPKVSASPWVLPARLTDLSALDTREDLDASGDDLETAWRI